MIGIAVWLCVYLEKKELIWPAIAVIVSLHLIPLARIFHVREYYVTAAAGSIVSITAYIGLSDLHAVAFLAVGMATVMRVSAIYLLRYADAIAARALQERWAV